MKVVIQRVSSASVTINNLMVSEIKKGLLILLGIATTDTVKDVVWLSKKIVMMRIFEDVDGKMNRSLLDEGGEVLLVSQFTLYGNAIKGNRPSFINAARPETAIPLYETMINQLSSDLNRPIKTGVFGADMKVALINDGPVTIILDSASA